MRLLQREVAAVRALRTRRFLGLELATVYVGPLLIVMPAGFGIYDGGRSTAAESRMLGKLPRPGRLADALTRAAANAVRKRARFGGPSLFPYDLG